MPLQIEETKGNIEETKIQNVYKCENCEKVYKTRGGLYKHKQKCIVEEEEEEDIESEDENQSEYSEDGEEPQQYMEQGQNEMLRQKLQQELRTLVINNPSAINLEKPIFLNELEKINDMSVEELQARIIDAKLTFNRKIDSKVSDSALTLTNQVVGGILGCVEELEQEVQNDLVLREATKDLLSFKVLNHIPLELKVSGLYSLNVATALKKNRTKRASQTNKIKVEEITDN